MEYLRPLKDIRLTDTALVGTSFVLLAEAERHSAELGITIAPTNLLTTEAYSDFLAANQLMPIIKSEWKAYVKAKPDDRHGIATRLRARLRRAILPAHKQARQTGLPAALTHELAEALKLKSSAKSNTALVITADIITSHEQLEPSTFKPESQHAVFTAERLNLAVQTIFLSLFSNSALAEWLRTDTDPAQLLVAISFQPAPLHGKAVNGTLVSADVKSGNPALTYITVADSPAPFESLRKGQLPAASYSLFTAGVAANLGSIIRSRVSKKVILATKDVLSLAQWGIQLEKHYGFPISFFWSSNPRSSGFLIRQIIPLAKAKSTAPTIKTYHFIDQPPTEQALVQGVGYGESIATGTALVIRTPKQLARLTPGDIVIMKQLEPRWQAQLRQAGGLVIEQAGDTLPQELSREWGIPIIVGATGARCLVTAGSPLTIETINSTAAAVYHGRWSFHTEQRVLSQTMTTRVVLYLDTTPLKSASALATMPTAGSVFTAEISKPTNTPQSLAESIAVTASAFYPRPFLVTLPNTNTDKRLPDYATALHQVRDQWGLTNVGLILPVAATASATNELLKKALSLGLETGKNDLALYLSHSSATTFEQISQITSGITGWSLDVTTFPTVLPESLKKNLYTTIRLAHARRQKINVSLGSLCADSDILPLLIQEKVDSLAMAPPAWWRLHDEIISLETKFSRLIPLRFWSTTGRFERLPERALSTLGIIGLSVSLAGYTCQTVNQSGSNAELQTNLQAQLTALKIELTQEISDQLARQRATSESTYREDGFAHFSLQYPSTWTISGETYAVHFMAPDGKGWFRVAKQYDPVLPLFDSLSSWHGFESYRQNFSAISSDVASSSLMIVPPPGGAKVKYVIVFSGDTVHFDSFLNQFSQTGNFKLPDEKPDK